jgi:cytochrome c-type biogenesis protein CcmH
MRTTMAVVMAGACLAACTKEPAPPPASPAPGSGLRPLTSRDGNDPAQASPPGAQQSLPPGHPPVGAGESKAAPAAGGAVSGSVALASKLQGRQTGAAVLFIIARSSSTKQILAVRKDQPTSFPFSFTISAADAMVAGTAFEGPVDITARLSRTGDAMPGAGDIEGTARDIAVGKKNVTVTLDSVRQ